MLDNWLSPLDTDELNISNLEKYQWGANIKLFSGKMPNLQQVKLAIIGIGTTEANLVRKGLYQMSFPFKGLDIVDLGNFKKKEQAFIIPLIKELLESKIVPIIIGNSAGFMTAQYRAFKSLKELINVTLVDELIPFTGYPNTEKSMYLDEILSEEKSHLFHLGILGCQRHYVNFEAKNVFDKLHFEYIGLGDVHQNIQEIEPVIRDADLLSFNLSAMKQIEAPAQEKPTPTGLSIEESCQIARYAGMSDKLRSFGVFGFKDSDFGNNQTAEVVAQMLWYFIDGYYHRKDDFPVSTKGLIEYIVHAKHEQIVFWKSSKSGRWWLQIPILSDKKYQRHYLVPCSFNDYKMASNGELPDRLLNAFKRIL